MQPIRRTARHSLPGVLALAGLAFGGGCGDPVRQPACARDDHNHADDRFST